MGLSFALFTYGTDDRNYGPAVLCPLVAGLLFLIHFIKSGGGRLPLTMTVFAVAAFFVYLLLSCFWSSIPYTSFYFILIFMLMPLLFFTVIASPEPERTLRFVLLGVGGVMGAVMLWALYQYIFYFGGPQGTRIKHPFLDPNNLAVFMNMALLPLLALTFCVQGKFKKAALGAAALLFLMALLATNSRMGFLSAAAGMAVLAPFIIRQSERPLLLAAGLLVLLVAVILGTNAYMDGALFYYVTDLIDFKKSYSVHDRLALWMSSIQIFQDYFWQGTGLATFFYYYPQYRIPTDNSDGYFVHMDPLQIGLETGVLGYVLLYLFLICVMFRTMRVLLLRETSVREKLLVLAPFTGLLTLCLHMHMTFALYLPAVALPAGALLAWWYVMTERFVPARNNVPVADKRLRGVLLLGALILLTGIIWGGRAVAGIYLNQKVDTLLIAGQEEQAQKLLIWEERLSPGSYHRPYEQQAQIIREKMKQNRAAPLSTRLALFEEGIEAIDEAIKRQPRHNSLKNTKAMLYYMVGEDARPGSVDEAIQILRAAIQIDPMMMDGRMGLAMILRERGEFVAALKTLEEGMLWPRPKGVPDVNYITTTAKYNLMLGKRSRHDQLMAFAAERARGYGFVVTGP